jgi:choline dehydrogenase-like flavoprotein
MNEYDVCVIGSGAGGGPVALTLSQAGASVVVLEKGPWYTEKTFFKDEKGDPNYTPNLRDEQHVTEELDSDEQWVSTPTSESGWSFWNGNMVGGSSNLMSGFFTRLKPDDFRLLSTFGPVAGANMADWPISYEDLEPYYTKVESVVGISGKVVPHPHAEPRSTPDFPYPPTQEHFLSGMIDQACKKLGYHSLPLPRAVLSQPDMGRESCQYSGYCGSYGCASGAKGSSRAALLDHAVKTGRCEIRPHAQVQRLISDKSGKVTAAEYIDEHGKKLLIRAKVFVVACQAIETSRLLLLSTGPKHPQGLGNQSGQVGKNLIFSAGGSGRGDFSYSKFTPEQASQLKQIGPFVDRHIQDWYFYTDPKTKRRSKGGTIDFLLRHPNPLSRAQSLRRDSEGKLLWGSALKTRLLEDFTQTQSLDFEVFNDWHPTDNCYVSLDGTVKDKWNVPVAKMRLGAHKRDLEVGEFLTNKALTILQGMGAENISGGASSSPPANLVAGGCRFGNDPKTSVLDADCRVHTAENVFVTDGSFMPTGGSVPYTWTIYANAFRVADIIKKQLSI